ncbi:hypothetical protein BGZ50_005868 [Haplosporangium sp. Z 11]|nr:hypothetical protein BGZ50_005868 [Haplosporangium sp. Z 11]
MPSTPNTPSIYGAVPECTREYEQDTCRQKERQYQYQQQQQQLQHLQHIDSDPDIYNSNIELLHHHQDQNQHQHQNQYHYATGDGYQDVTTIDMTGYTGAAYYSNYPEDQNGDEQDVPANVISHNKYGCSSSGDAAQWEPCPQNSDGNSSFEVWQQQDQTEELERQHQQEREAHRRAIISVGSSKQASLGAVTAGCPLTQHNALSKPAATPTGKKTKSRSNSIASSHVQAAGVRVGRGVSLRISPLKVADTGNVLRNAQPSSSSSSPPGKTGWEREDATPTTPMPQQFLQNHEKKSEAGARTGTEAGTGAGTPNASQIQPQHQQQHSMSIFDFFRGRKASTTPKNVDAAEAVSPSISNNGTLSTYSTLALKGTPPPIAKSRMNTIPFNGCQPSNRSAASTPILSSASVRVKEPVYDFDPSSLSIQSTTTASTTAAALPQSSQPIAEKSPVITPTTPAHSITSSAHSTFTRVAAVVVGATVGRRRPSVASELESGNGYHLHPHKRGHPPILMQQNVVGSEAGGSGINGDQAQTLNQAQLEQHAIFMKTEKSIPELKEYISRMYQTILGKDVALEFSKKQILALQKELDQTRFRSEGEKRTLVSEVDHAKEIAVAMEEELLQWRTKVHNEQMAQQESFLHERLVKQDQIEQLEEELGISQEEVDRLRSRLLVLEYEDGYVGPSSLLTPPVASTSGELKTVHDHEEYHRQGQKQHHYQSLISTASGQSYHTERNTGKNTHLAAIKYGPMTVENHKRRSTDFRILEQRAQSFERAIQELKRNLETERQSHQRDLVDFRMRMNDKCVILEQQIQAAKMESTMYSEMMHEIASENDNLRKQVKSAKRKLREFSQEIDKKSKSTTMSMLFGFPSTSSLDDTDESACESEGDMEEIDI